MATDLPKTYDPTAVEAEAIRVWNDEKLFHAEPTDPGNPYSIVIPPPNVTAALHLGHALNNTLQDILTRVHRMMGDNTEWVPGTDHAGIATQTVVEKRVLAEEGKRRTDFAREEFVQKIQAWKDEYETRILGQLQRMGCSCDWDRTAFTMDEPRARAVREAFFQLFKDGLIYRGKRLVNWDPATQTALADDEVEMEEVNGHFYYLRYPLADAASPSPGTPGEGRGEGSAYVTVATTRPETMLGDTAVAINPKDPRAEALRGKFVRLPIVNRVIPIIEDDYVVLPDPKSDDPKAQFATGFLKVTPAHDPNDYEIGQRHKLDMINVLAPDGSISDKHGWTDIGDAGFLLGKDRFEARKLVVDWFKQNALLEEIKPYTHSVGHSYRSHVPIEPYLSDQWYCKVTDDRLAGAALRAMARDQYEGSAPLWSRLVNDDADDPATTSRNRKGAVLSSSRDNPPFANIPLPSYFITFTCYGTWLHGDKRGSADSEHNLPGTPYLIGDEQREREEFAAMKHPATTLDEAQRRVVHQTVMEVCQHRGWSLLTLHVRPKHLHAVVSASEATPEKVMNDFKAYATRRLREAQLVEDEARVWTRHGSTRYLNDFGSVEAACQYVVEEQGAPLEPRPYDSREPDTSRDREGAETGVARTPLPNGRDSSNTWEGQLRFFPARYARTFQTWHENIRDWCISRQLWWGHRIPVWRYKMDGWQMFPTPDRQSLYEDVTEKDKNAIRAALELHRAHPDKVHVKIELENVDDERFAELLFAQNWDSDIPEYVYVSVKEDDTNLARWLEPVGFTHDPDVLDTWFSSGLWPLSTLGWPDDTALRTPHSALNVWNPTSVLCTAREIITLWVSRMVMFNLYFLNRLPFAHVFIHAMIQDGHGQKMSKSLGNGVDPVDIIHSHGSDAMRFTLASMATNTQDVRMPVDMVDPHGGQMFTPEYVTDSAGHKVAAAIQTSPKDPKKKMVSSYGVASGKAQPTKDMPLARNTSSKFDLGRNFCNKLWNAARFAMMNLGEKSDEATKRPSDEGESLSLVDRWIVSRFHRTVAEANDALNNYRFDQYARAVYDFFWRDFCDWYLEAIKPAMKDPKRAARSAQVLASVLDASLRLLHPVIPFITETIWWRLNDVWPDRGIEGLPCPPSERLIKAAWPDGGQSDDGVESDFSKLQAIIIAIRNARNEHKVDPKKSVDVSILTDVDTAWLLKDDGRELIELLATCKLDAGEQPVPDNAARVIVSGAEVYIRGLVDPQAEQQRSGKRREELTKLIASMKGRLSNSGYIAKAPPHLVKQTQDQLAEAEAELAKLA